MASLEQMPVVSGRRPLAGVRRTADTGYAYLSVLFFAAVLVQVFLAGTGVFGIDALEIDEAEQLRCPPHMGFGPRWAGRGPARPRLGRPRIAADDDRRTRALPAGHVCAERACEYRRKLRVGRRTARSRRDGHLADLGVDRAPGESTTAFTLGPSPNPGRLPVGLAQPSHVRLGHQNELRPICSANSTMIPSGPRT